MCSCNFVLATAAWSRGALRSSDTHLPRTDFHWQRQILLWGRLLLSPPVLSFSGLMICVCRERRAIAGLGHRWGRTRCNRNGPALMTATKADQGRFYVEMRPITHVATGNDLPPFFCTPSIPHFFWSVGVRRCSNSAVYAAGCRVLGRQRVFL